MFSVLSDLCCEFAPYGCQTRVKIYCWMLRDHCNFAIWWELPRIPLGPACRCILWSHEHANDSLALGVVPTQYHFFRQNVMNAPDIKRGSEHFNFRADKLLLHERCIGTPIATSPNQNPAKNWKFSTTKAAAAQLKDACLSFPMLGPVRNPQANFGLWGNWSELLIRSETRVFKLCSLGMWTCQTWFWSVYSLYVHSWIRLFNILCWNQLDVNFNAPWFWCKSGIGSAPLVIAPERSPKGEHGRLVDLFLVIQTMKVLHDITMLYLFVYDCT